VVVRCSLGLGGPPLMLRIPSEAVGERAVRQWRNGPGVLGPRNRGPRTACCAWAEKQRLTEIAKTAPRTKEGSARLNASLADLVEQGRPKSTVDTHGSRDSTSHYEPPRV
jgi:hypothetical protein